MKNKTTEQLVDVRGHDQMPMDSDAIAYSEMYEEYILKEDALEGLSAEYGLVHTDHEDDFNYVESRGLKYHIDDSIYSDEMMEYIHNDSIVSTYSGEIATQQWLQSSDEWYYIERGMAADEWVWYEDTTFCEDIQESVHHDDAYYCEYQDESFYYEDSLWSHSSEDRSVIHAYHKGPQPKDLSEGAQFKVGFEIEKTDIEGYEGDDDSVGEEIGFYDLIAKFETDSSCGLEAITHILPLSGVRSKRRKNVFKMIDAAASVINSDCDTSCGGHITISVMFKNDRRKYMNSLDVLEKIRGNLSILYALYRYRLNNDYCDNNKNLKNLRYRNRGVVTIKDDKCIEIRLPNRVQNTNQLKLRYDLMYILVRRSLEGMKYSKLLQEVKPILLKMYRKDKDKVKLIMNLSKMFRRYIISEKVTPEIREFIYGDNEEE